jgi:hypothetical protein
LPFKCNLQRYTTAASLSAFLLPFVETVVVGLCGLNQVDPCPITYNLSSEKPVSKSAFQVHNLHRYIVVP